MYSCTNTNCQNGGTCANQICTCLPQYTGSFCENSLITTQCGSFPCKNKGICFNANNGYICSCPSNYAGLNCEIRINYCASMPCSNNEACVDQMNGYMCVAPCSTQPCLNGCCLNTVNII